MDFLFLLFFLPAVGAGILAAICFATGSALLVSAGKEFRKAMETGALARSPRQPEVATSESAVTPASPVVLEKHAPTGTSGCDCATTSSKSSAEPEYQDIPGVGFVRTADYETRADGKLVRKDRWETGMRNIAGILTGPRAGFEIEDVVEKVRAIAKAAQADYESGGNGLPGSAPKWGPCPAQCDNGQVPGKLYEDCPTCDGRARVVVEPPTVSTDNN